MNNDPDLDPFDPARLQIPADYFAKKAEVKSVPSLQPIPRSKQYFWKLNHETGFALAKTFRAPWLAVIVEVHHLWFKAYDKSQPIELGNTAFRKWKIDPKVKNRALRRLEKMGLFKVQWRKNKAPLVSWVGH
jgi:hypothetical protein